MFVVELICPDLECAEPFEARAATLAELELLACDCGFLLQITRVADALGDTDPTLLLVGAG